MTNGCLLGEGEITRGRVGTPYVQKERLNHLGFATVPLHRYRPFTGLRIIRTATELCSRCVRTRPELAPISNCWTIAKELLGAENEATAPLHRNKPAQGHGPGAVASLRPGYSYTATGE